MNAEIDLRSKTQYKCKERKLVPKQLENHWKILKLFLLVGQFSLLFQHQMCLQKCCCLYFLPGVLYCMLFVLVLEYYPVISVCLPISICQCFLLFKLFLSFSTWFHMLRSLLPHNITNSLATSYPCFIKLSLLFKVYCSNRVTGGFVLQMYY